MTQSKSENNDTRKTIIMSALKLFSEKGFQSTSISEICKNANVTKGALYWHFKDKQDLYLQLMYDVIREILVESMNDVSQEKSPLMRLKKHLNNYLKQISTNEIYQEAYRLFVREMHFDQFADMEKLSAQVKQDYNFESYFQDAVAQGELPQVLTVEQYYEMYTHMFDGVIINWLMRGKQFDLIETGNELFDYVYRIDLLRRENEV